MKLGELIRELERIRTVAGPDMPVSVWVQMGYGQGKIGQSIVKVSITDFEDDECFTRSKVMIDLEVRKFY